MIDGLISMEGLAEFSSDRLHLVVTRDYRVPICEPPFAVDTLVSVPLNELELDFRAVSYGGLMRHMAVDAAALIAWTDFD
jgi:hypothetical protein